MMLFLYSLTNSVHEIEGYEFGCYMLYTGLYYTISGKNYLWHLISFKKKPMEINQGNPKNGTVLIQC